MIFVGSRDGRKGLGLGLGLGLDGEREMEETELEEGEACCYQNDDNLTIDPDVALSYIDEKLQDVLGHFQKDFEGGVSAENLGAKFGGYGSFLPTYQRSPAWSHPRTPPKVHNYNTPRSPNNLHLEGGRHNSVVSSSASVPARLGPASVSAASLPALRAPSVNDSLKRDACVSSTSCAEESSSRCELVNRSANPSDHKILKVRIKVGSDNLSARKNAEIYSGLGLDVSPSSSLDDSPTDSETVSPEPQDTPDESPTSILQIMTSFPVLGNLLLSPLPDDLIRLTEKEKLRGESRSGPVHKESHESSVMLVNGPDSAKGDWKVLGEKQPKSSEKNFFLMELKNCNGNDASSGTGVLLKKETEVDSLACEELVSNALKLPLLSNSYCNVIDSTKCSTRAIDISKVANRSGVKDESFPDLAKEEPLEPASTLEIGRVEKPNGNVGSAVKVWETKKVNSLDDDSLYMRKEGNLKGEKTDVSVKADSNVSKGRKALNSELIDFAKQKAGQKATSHEEDGMKLAPGKEQSSSGGKKKSKGGQSNGAQGAEVLKDGLRINSSLAPKSRNSTHANIYMSKSEAKDFKKDYGKARERYKDFFGELELEQGDNEMALEEMHSVDRLKDSEVVEKSTFEFNSTSKERLNGKKIDKPSTSEAYLCAALNVAPLTGNGPISDAAPAIVAPVVEEYWVCCDKCQTWRLLPPGINPDNLPEKWLCSMLNWLPGMNRCNISEEETTKALRALYQIPAPASAPESQSNQHGHPGGVLSGVSSADAWHFDQNHQNLGLHDVPVGGKKKHGLKYLSNATNQDGLTPLPNSMKKSLQASLKSRNLNGMNQSPPVNERDFQHFGQSSSLVVEKHRHKQKEKNKPVENYSDGGDTKNLKFRNKRDSDQDCIRASKKIKTDGNTDEDWTSDHGGAILKVGHSSSSGLSINVSGKDHRKYNGRSNDSKNDTKDNLRVSVRNAEDQNQITSDDGSLHMRKCDGKDNVKKRKSNEGQDSQIYTVSFPSVGHHLQDSRDFMEGSSENDHKKEKKARVSKFEGKETSASKGSGGTDKRSRSMKDQQLGPELASTLSQQSLDVIDSLKRDLGSVQPSVAATSSSSKVSGSHKNKANLQEVKGSPVESVSSSPLRVLNPDKFASTRNLAGKDNSRDTDFLATVSPRRCSDGEDDGASDPLGATRKDETFIAAAHHSSLDSSVVDFQDRNLRHISGSNTKAKIVSSPGFATRHVTDGNADTLCQVTQHPCKPQTSDQCRNEERGHDNQYRANGSHPRKSGKASSSRSKDKNQSYRSEFDKGEVKISDSFNESIDHTPYEEKSKAGRNKFQDKSAVNSGKVEKNLFSKKDSAGKLLSESGKRESQSKFGGHDGSDVRIDAISSQDPKQNLLLDRDGERSSKRFLFDKTDRMEVSGKVKSHSLPPSGRGQNDTVTRCPQPIHGSPKGNGVRNLSEADGALKAPKQIKNAENQNGNQPINLRHPTPCGHKVRDVDAPSPVRRDSSSQAATNAVKEAKDLKHLADRLKNSGSNLESTGYYFQAALKFLHGASLLESCNSESSKHSEMYGSTAKLCEFCAHEYEKCKDMAAAALAYKCMEVAYMRVIYSSHTIASKDRRELQTALPIVPPGESPSSSASDIDNLNNPATVDKVALAKGVSPSQVTGNHVIAARNRSSFVRLLDFARDVNFAMEASRKSRIAFAACNPRLEGAQHREGISSVKRALDFNFQDVEGLLRLVRLAMEAITR